MRILQKFASQNHQTQFMKKTILFTVIGGILSFYIQAQKADSICKRGLEVGLEVSSFFKNQQTPFVLFRYNTKPISFRFYAVPTQTNTETTSGLHKGNFNKLRSWKIAGGLQKNIWFNRGFYYFGADYVREKGKGSKTGWGDTLQTTLNSKGICLLTGIKFRLFDKVYLNPEVGYLLNWWTKTDEDNANGNSKGTDFGFNYWGLFVSYNFSPVKLNGKHFLKTSRPSQPQQH